MEFVFCKSKGGDLIFTNVKEEWRPIDGFPAYEVSNLGRIANVYSDVLIQPSKTLQGALKVGLFKDDRQHTRSVKVLVADAFVEGRTHVFDTPILLDGNQENVVAHNIVWRPRWFAWHYTRQFTYDFEFYKIGPIVELDHDGVVVAVYNNTIEVGVTNGLLFEHVWRAIHTREGVFPTRQYFVFEGKV